MIKKSYIQCILYFGIFYVLCTLFFFIKTGVCEESQVSTDYESMSVREFAQHIKSTPISIVNTLKMNGIRVKDADQRINDIASKNKVLPAVIYEILVSNNKEVSGSPADLPVGSGPSTGAKDRSLSEGRANNGSGSRSSKRGKNKGGGLGKGYGQQTIELVCRELDIPIKKAKKRLKARGIVADNNTELRDIAAKYNLRPRDIVDIIQTKKKGFWVF